MYNIDKSRKMLFLLQELYQQKVITREDKNNLAQMVKNSIKTKSFEEVKKKWKKTPCLRPEKQSLLNEIDYILGGK